MCIRDRLYPCVALYGRIYGAAHLHGFHQVFAFVVPAYLFPESYEIISVHFYDFVPTSMIYPLYDAAACEKDLLIIKGAGHGQSKEVDPNTYRCV